MNRCIKIDPKNLQAYAYKADCLKAIGDYTEAIKIYTEVLGITFDEEILLKRAIAFIDYNDFENALNDLNKLI